MVIRLRKDDGNSSNRVLFFDCLIHATDILAVSLNNLLPLCTSNQIKPSCILMDLME